MEAERRMTMTAGQAFEDFCTQRGLDPEGALEILKKTVTQREALMERARRIMEAINTIGDKDFTVDSLRADPKAMQMVEEGAPVGQVYRERFVKRNLPAMESEANLGMEGLDGEVLTEDEIERIAEYISRTGKSVEL